MKELSKTRSVIVQNEVFYETKTDQNNTSNSYNNQICNVIGLSDNGILTVGMVYAPYFNGYSNTPREAAYIAKYDENFEIKWSKIIGSPTSRADYDAYCYDAIEDSNGNIVNKYNPPLLIAIALSTVISSCVSGSIYVYENSFKSTWCLLNSG